MASKAIDFILNVKGNAVDKTDQLADNLDEAGDSADGTDASMAALSVGLVALATAAVAAAAALFSMRDAQVALIDETNTLAASTGFSNELIQGLRLSADATGKSLSELVPKNLAKRALDAANGLTKAQLAFEQVGISVEDLVGPDGSLVNMDDLLLQVIDNLGDVEDKGTKAALATALLGTQGQQMLTAFGDSKELLGFVKLAREFGTDVGPEAVRQASAWQRSTAILALAFTNVTDGILEATGAGSIMITIMDSFAAASVFFGTIFAGMIEEALKRIGLLGSALMALADGQFRAAGDALSQSWLPDVDLFVALVKEADRKGKAIIRQGGRSLLNKAVPDDPEGGGPTRRGPLLVELGDNSIAAIEKGQPDENPWPEFLDSLDVLVAISKDELQEIKRQEAIAAASGTMDTIATGLGSAEGLASIIGNVFLPGMGELIGQGVGMARNLDDTLESLFADVSTLPDDLGSSIRRTMIEVQPAIIRAIPDLLEAVIISLPLAIAEGIILGIPELVKALGSAALDAAGRVIGFLDGAMSFLFGDWWEGAKDFFKGIWDGIGNAINTIMDGAVIQWIIGAFETIWTTIRDFFSGLFDIGGGNGALVGQQGNVLGTNFRGNQGDVQIFGVGIPGFASGGFATKTGLAMLHEGERVVPASGASTGTAAGMMGRGGINIQNMTVKANDPREFLRAIERELGDFGMGETFTPFSPG